MRRRKKLDGEWVEHVPDPRLREICKKAVESGDQAMVSLLADYASLVRPDRVRRKVRIFWTSTDVIVDEGSVEDAVKVAMEHVPAPVPKVVMVMRAVGSDWILEKTVS